MDEEFKTYKKDAVKAAEELRYGDNVVLTELKLLKRRLKSSVL